MKKNRTNTIRQLAGRFGAWFHRILDQKGEHIEECGWYPGPCQTEFPY